MPHTKKKEQFAGDVRLFYLSTSSVAGQNHFPYFQEAFTNIKQILKNNNKKKTKA